MILILKRLKLELDQIVQVMNAPFWPRFLLKIGFVYNRMMVSIKMYI